MTEPATLPGSAANQMAAQKEIAEFPIAGHITAMARKAKIQSIRHHKLTQLADRFCKAERSGIPAPVLWAETIVECLAFKHLTAKEALYFQCVLREEAERMAFDFRLRGAVAEWCPNYLNIVYQPFDGPPDVVGGSALRMRLIAALADVAATIASWRYATQGVPPKFENRE